jgi:serine/threonine protein kinase
MYLLLGRCLGVGGFAAVYLASVVPSSIVTSSSKGGAHMMAAMAAAAAAAAGPAGHSSDAVTFAVKVFHSSKPGVTDGELQRMAAQELRSLELLRGYNTAAQLMAVGELVTSPTHSAHSATGIAAANASNSRPSAAAGHMIDVRSGSSSSKLSDDQLPRCAVLELAQFSLHEVVQRLKRCSEVYASAVARELLTFLEAAQSGATGYVITHRDLKPANILVRATGSIAVADFGACHITKAAAAAAAGVSMQTGIGTVMYAPPELYDVPEQSSDSSGGGGGYDGSIDVFALGVIVVEMLAGGGGWMASVTSRRSARDSWHTSTGSSSCSGWWTASCHCLVGCPCQQQRCSSLAAAVGLARSGRQQQQQGSRSA